MAVFAAAVVDASLLQPLFKVSGYFFSKAVM